MTKTLLLFKTLYRDYNAKSEREEGKKRKISGNAVATIALLPLVAVIAVAVGYVSSTLTDAKQLATMICSIVIGVQLFSMFLSMGTMFSTMYGAKDFSLLQSLPVRPIDVFVAKFALVYVTVFKMTAIVLLPCVYSMLIGFNIANGAIFYGAYVLVLLLALVAPVLPLFVVTLFSMPLSWIGSYIKGKSTLKSVLVILFYVVLMCAYMVVVYFVNTTGFGQEGDEILSDGMLSTMATLATVFYPDKVTVYFCLGIDAGKNFGISLAITVGIVCVTLLLCALFYKRIITKNSEHSSQDVNKTESFKQNNVVVSLAKRDMKMIMRNSSLAMGAFANIILAPIFIVLMYFIGGFKQQSGAEEGMTELMSQMMNIGFVVMYSMIFFSGANMLANQAYTREGKSFFATKSLPIRPVDSIKSKLLLATIVPAIVMVPVMLIALLLFGIDVVSTLFIAIDTMLMVVGVCSMSILFDMKKGNQHWETTSELRTASKGNYYQIISAFVSIIPAIALFVLGMMLSGFAEFLGEVLVKTIYWAVATLISVAVCVTGVLLLKNLGEKWYAYIGENKTARSGGYGSKNNYNIKGLMK